MLTMHPEHLSRGGVGTKGPMAPLPNVPLPLQWFFDLCTLGTLQAIFTMSEQQPTATASGAEATAPGVALPTATSGAEVEVEIGVSVVPDQQETVCGSFTCTCLTSADQFASIAAR